MGNREDEELTVVAKREVKNYGHLAGFCYDHTILFATGYGFDLDRS
jgi:hypothetical protein